MLFSLKVSLIDISSVRILKTNQTAQACCLIESSMLYGIIYSYAVDRLQSDYCLTQHWAVSPENPSSWLFIWHESFAVLSVLWRATACKVSRKIGHSNLLLWKMTTGYNKNSRKHARMWVIYGHFTIRMYIAKVALHLYMLTKLNLQHVYSHPLIIFFSDFIIKQP